jgi:Alpha/beta hydrolase domain
MTGRTSARSTSRAVVAAALAVGLVTAGSALADGTSNGNGPAAGSQRDVDSPTVPNPIVTGPIQGGTRGGAYNRSRFPLTHGYVEEEYFFQGVARAADGSTAPYKSRILVRRPSDPRQFNGSVILDWDNVTVPDDTDVGWLPMHTTIMDRGFVYVAVAAQELSIEKSPIALKQYDPVRYGSLSHPGDNYSFDIYSQAAEAVLDPIVLGDLRPLVTRRIGIGASQSGSRLHDYINNWAEKAGVFEGFIPELASPADINRDLVPILWLNSQSEGKGTTVPPDSDLFRYWEMAGSAHAPHDYSQYQNSGYVYHETNGNVDIYDRDEGDDWGFQNKPGDCGLNNFEPGYEYSAALVTLDDWVRTGNAPPVDPSTRFDRTGGTLHYDDMSNIVGGVRSPIIDIPIAKYYAGQAPTGGSPCSQTGALPLVGGNEMMTAAELAAKYPTSQDYADAFKASLQSAVDRGWVLPEGAEHMLHDLRQAQAYVAAAVGS